MRTKVIMNFMTGFQSKQKSFYTAKDLEMYRVLREGWILLMIKYCRKVISWESSIEILWYN